MRFFALLLLFVAASAYGAYSNDSSSVDINYTGPAEDQLIPPPGGGGGNLFGAGGDSGDGGDSEDDSFEDSDEVTIPVTVVTETPAGGSNEGAGAGEGEGGGFNFRGITAQDIIDTLKGNQAFTIETGGSGGGWWILKISGSKARAALKARGITKITLLGAFRNKFLSRGDMTIAAASSLLENENLEEVIISLDTFSLSYKARGRLLGVFPWEYPVGLVVNPYGTTVAERVAVKLPWYRFFLQTYFSRSALQQEIDEVMTAALAGEEEGIDARTRLYVSVTDSIKSRFDTVEGSL